eukprot:4642365-Karenia_brevis.AAC.1
MLQQRDQHNTENIESLSSHSSNPSDAPGSNINNTLINSDTRKNGSVSALPRTEISIMWWNIQHISSAWADSSFWEVLDFADVVLLSETHHNIVPERDGWVIYGKAFDMPNTGNVLALCRVAGQ